MSEIFKHKTSYHEFILLAQPNGRIQQIKTSRTQLVIPIN